METLQRTANSGSVSTGYDIENSVILEAAASEHFYKTNSSAGNRRTFTFSFWTKRTSLSGVKQYIVECGNSDADDDRFTIRFGTGDTLDIQTSATYLITNRKFRDLSAWYHIVLKVDTTEGSAANRMKLYVNGVEETSFATDNRANINENFDFSVNNTEIHNIGSSPIENLYANGYIAEWVQIDGTASAPTAFGEVDEDSGIWKPIDVSGLTFGTNGFHLDFEASGDLGNDANGGTDFTLVNIAAADQATDTPTNNFATLNPLQKFSGTASNNPILTEGATVHTSTLDDYWQTSIATIGVTSGKWYFEAKILDDNTPLVMVGVGDEGDIPTWGWGNGYLGAGKSVSYSSGSSAYTDSNVIGMAVDVDNGKVYWAKDNTYINSGNPAGNANGTALPTGGVSNGTYFIGVSGYKDDAAVLQVNFGGYHANSLSSAASDGNGYGTFEFAPPSGFYSLCTKNLAEFGG